MRRDLIEARREGKSVFYSLRESGEELIRVIGSLLEATGQGDPSMGEDSDDAEDTEFSHPADPEMDDVSDGGLKERSY
jgi:hypothetical protein